MKELVQWKKGFSGGKVSVVEGVQWRKELFLGGSSQFN